MSGFWAWVQQQQQQQYQQHKEKDKKEPVALKVDVLQDRRTRAPFSPEIVQAGATKGLSFRLYRLATC